MAIWLTLTIIYCAYKTIVNAQCDWTVNIPGGSNFTLYLSCAAGRQFVTTDSDGSHNFLFSLCSNSETCDGNSIMTKQTPLDDEACYVLGVWDPNVQPTYQSDNGGRWTFEYAGANDCGNPTRVWSPTFQCDSAEFDIDTVQEAPGSCFYTVTIHTKYACTQNMDCQNATTTTPPPSDLCVWSDGENTLNLTQVEGFVLNKISDNDAQQIYSISPCSNNINCNDDIGMITISTISSCIQKIAEWDEGFTQPKYSSNFGGQWEFVYTNGDACANGPESVVTVFWNCNPLAGTATIKAAKEIGMCNFEIQIDSNLACS